VIAQRSANSVYLDSAVDKAIAVFTTPLANADPQDDKTSVVDDIQKWMEDERGKGGRKPAPGNIDYSVLAVLVAFYLLIQSSKKVSLAGVLQVLLFETTPEQRQRLGMTSDLAGTRADLIATANDEDAPIVDQLAGRKARDREYARLAKFTAAMFAGFDPSVFHKADTLTRPEKAQSKAEKAQAKASNTTTDASAVTLRRSRAKMTNEQRHAILANAQHPDRRIDDATSERNYERLLDVMNKVVAYAAKRAKDTPWHGDIATDETVLITLPARYRHGTRPELLTSSDPDAYYWPGKRNGSSKNDDDDDADSGFGYGVTFIVRMGRPYDRRVPEVALGIHIGRPTGGRTEPVRAALERAERHGLLLPSRQRRLIADRGYTGHDDWMPFLLEKDSVPVLDYPATWDQDIPIKDYTAEKDAKGKPKVASSGPRLIGGRIRCPGAQGLSEKQMVKPHDEKKGEETDEEIIERDKRTRLLDALAMPVKRGLLPLVDRKKDDASQPEVAQTWSITVQCPAALGMVNCPLVEPSEGRDPTLQDVPNPPSVGHQDLLPRACRQDHVTYHLPLTHAKRLQPFTWGSHAWADAYRPIRSANEQYHSQFKHSNSGGVRESWLEMRGIAKHGLLASISSAVTVANILSNFRTAHVLPDGQTAFHPREAQRRKRHYLLKSKSEETP